MKSNHIYILLTVLVMAPRIYGQTTTINFEGVPDSTEVGNYYSGAGVYFSDAVALTAGVSLNEIDYPPHSGVVAVADDGSPIMISFDSLVGNISAYFAHADQLTFTAFGSGGGLIGAYTDPISATLDADELVTLSFTDISSLQISSATPGSYVFDDFSFQPLSPAPDAGSTLLLLAVTGNAVFIGRKYFVINGKGDN